MADGQISMKRRRSRKEHACIWCGGSILKGARYGFQVYAFDGVARNAHWHEACIHDSQKGRRFGEEFEFDPYTGEQPFPGLSALEKSLGA